MDSCNQVTIHFAGLVSTKFSRKTKNAKIVLTNLMHLRYVTNVQSMYSNRTVTWMVWIVCPFKHCVLHHNTQANDQIDRNPWIHWWLTALLICTFFWLFMKMASFSQFDCFGKMLFNRWKRFLLLYNNYHCQGNRVECTRTQLSF